ncbi:MAG: MgtC/SapB family protein [Thermoanaerobaculia bacterium]
MENGLFVPPTSAEWVLALRIACAALAGGLIGWNRHRYGKPAGVGTHALVALGSAMFVSIPIIAGAGHVDAVSRAIQGVATGVGFIGAGEIFREPGQRSRVTGLTSAAALWATAALGVVIVSGSLFGAAMGAILVIAVLQLAPRLEARFPPKSIDPP